MLFFIKCLSHFRIVIAKFHPHTYTDQLSHDKHTFENLEEQKSVQFIGLGKILTEKMGKEGDKF